MSSFARLAIGAAAVLIVGAVGINLIGSGGTGLGGFPSPSPTARPGQTPSPTQSQTQSPRAAPSFLAYDWPRPLLAGTYKTPFIWDVPIEVILAVPEGWQSRDVEVVKDPTLALTAQVVDNVYADPCKHVALTPKVGPSVDALAAALVALPGIDATAPTPVTFAGYTGKYLEFSVNADGGCPQDEFLFWSNSLDSVLPVGPLGPMYYGAEGRHVRVWILDVDGVRYVIAALNSDDATPADLAELQRVIDSIRLVPPATPEPSQAVSP